MEEERLGPVDGFDQDQAAGEADKGSIAFCGLFAAHCNALEAFELAHRLLDTGAGLIEYLGKEEAWPVLGIRTPRDDWNNAPPATGGAIGGGIIALVSQRRARRDVRPDVERDFQLGAVADLATSQMEADGQAIEVRLEVDLAREPAA